jgi:uncharacterized metal-binding protein
MGEIADRAARKLTKENTGQMFCLAGIGGRVEPIAQKTQAASKILAIDGCGVDCVEKTLEQAGFENFKHLQLADIGVEKFKSHVTEERIDKVVSESKILLSS